MTIMNRQLSLAVLALALAACDGTSSKDTPMGDGETDETPDTEEDAGTTPEPGEDAGVQNAPIPLEVWVDDLVEYHSDDESLPDTVDDKNIKDNEDPMLFDKYFDAAP